MMIVTVCPTDLTFEESLFTLQFATRVRNITVGPAQKHSNAKNLEEQIKAMEWRDGALVAATLLALAIDFRERIALALAVSVVLAWAQRQGWLFTWPRGRVVAYLGRISYSVFLLNFPVALVVNALFTRYGSADPPVQTGGVLLAWLACNLAGAAFHHAVEQPLSRLGRAPR